MILTKYILSKALQLMLVDYVDPTAQIAQSKLSGIVLHDKTCCSIVAPLCQSSISDTAVFQFC